MELCIYNGIDARLAFDARLDNNVFDHILLDIAKKNIADNRALCLVENHQCHMIRLKPRNNKRFFFTRPVHRCIYILTLSSNGAA